MALEKVTLQNAGGSQTVEPKAQGSQNSFNTSFGNLFVNEQTVAQQPQQNSNGSAGSSALFGNGIVQENEVKPQNTETAVQKNNASGLGVFSNYFKSIIPTFKEANDKANQYNAAVNNALKYIPSPYDLDILANSNPRIKAILAENGLPVKMNYDNLKTIKHTHLATTTEFATAIGEELGLSSSEIETMKKGAALHDLGKSLVPAEILNKNGRLTPEERKIINLHSVLGYELLKGLNLGINVAEIARDHHNPNSTNKYAQIVRAADVYSAMREQRSYKPAKSHEEAMAVLRDMNIKPQILNALDKVYGNPKKDTVTVPFHTQTAVA